MRNIVAPLAYFSAILGGIALISVTLITVASIAGRTLAVVFPATWLGPILGDYEVAEALIGFAIFCFLPICQFTAGHASVDVFTNFLSKQTNRVLVALWEVVAALVAVVIFWRLYEGMLNKLGNSETSYLLQFPIWWAYAVCLLPAAIFVLTALWSASDRITAVLRGQDSRALTSGDTH